MNAARVMSLTARVVCGTAWAMCLCVLGLSLLLDGPPAIWPGGHRGSWACLGVASCAAGLYVFMVMVADRLIPNVGRRMTMFPLEMCVLAALVVGVAAAFLFPSGGSLS